MRKQLLFVDPFNNNSAIIRTIAGTNVFNQFEPL